MNKRKKPTVQITIKQRKGVGLQLEVHNHNTPLFDYRKAKKSINGDIKVLKHEIWRARLLKVQAYIAYKLIK